MSDQQEFPDNPDDYTEAEHIEHTSSGKGLALPGQNLPDKVYVIPIHNRPFFPAQVLPVIVNEEPWAETLDLAQHHVDGLQVAMDDAARVGRLQSRVLRP